MQATRSPGRMPNDCNAADQRSQRSKNDSYVKRRPKSTAASQSPYSRRARLAKSNGLRGISMGRVNHGKARFSQYLEAPIAYGWLLINNLPSQVVSRRR